MKLHSSLPFYEKAPWNALFPNLSADVASEASWFFYGPVAPEIAAQCLSAFLSDQLGNENSLPSIETSFSRKRALQECWFYAATVFTFCCLDSDSACSQSSSSCPSSFPRSSYSWYARRRICS